MDVASSISWGFANLARHALVHFDERPISNIVLEFLYGETVMGKKVDWLLGATSTENENAPTI